MDNIEDCTKTKAVLNVLGPIAHQVQALKLRHGTECDAGTVFKLLKQCQSLQSAAEHLASSLGNHASTLLDNTLAAEVADLKLQLKRVTDDLTDVTRDLHRGDVGVRDNEEVWVDLVDHTESLLATLTQALLAWDRAQVRRVTSCISRVESELTELLRIDELDKLPRSFQGVVSMIMAMVREVQERSGAVYQRVQKDTLQLVTLQTMRTLSLLPHTLLPSILRPCTTNAAARNLITNRLKTLLSDLRVHVGVGNNDYDMDDPGMFVKSVDKVMSALGLEDPEDNSSNKTKSSSKEVDENTAKSPELKGPLEDVLRHSLAVAYCAQGNDHQVIRGMCDNIVKQVQVLVNVEKETNNGSEGDAVDVQVACDVLGDAVELLEQKVNTALIRLIVTVFAMPLEPLEHLKKAITEMKTSENDNNIDTLVMNFDLHVDRIFQVGGFAMACTHDAQGVGEIRDSLLTLEWLEGCLVPALISAHNQMTIKKPSSSTVASKPDNDDSVLSEDNILSKSSVSNKSSMSGKKGNHVNDALSHALLLADCWISSIQQLNQALLHIMEPSAFCLVTKEEFHKSWAGLRERLYTQDAAWLKQHVSRSIAIAQRLIDVHNLTPFLSLYQEKQINDGIAEVNRSLNYVVLSPADLVKHRSLMKRVQLLLTILTRLSSELNEENFPPDDDYLDDMSNIPQQQKSIGKANTPAKVLLTSNIKDVPLDTDTPRESPVPGITSIRGIGTPVTAPLFVPPQAPSITSGIPPVPNGGCFQGLRRSGRSSGRLGELRGRISGNSSATGTGLTTVGDSGRFCDTSIDISKYLSRSSNNVTSSRNSKRNFSLKVRYINLDMDGILNGPPSSSTSINKDARESTNTKENITTLSDICASQVLIDSNTSNKSELKDVSELIARELAANTTSGTMNNTIPVPKSPGDELSGILENLSTLADNLTALATTPSVPSQGHRKGRRFVWEKFSIDSSENKENLVKLKTSGSVSSLHGIKLNNASFIPQFPDIKPHDSSDIFQTDSSQIKNEVSIKCSSNMAEDLEASVWKNFTTILETKTPSKSRFFNFTSNFNSTTEGFTPTSHRNGNTGNVLVIKVEDEKHSNIKETEDADLSDTPFYESPSPKKNSISLNFPNESKSASLTSSKSSASLNQLSLKAVSQPNNFVSSVSASSLRAGFGSTTLSSGLPSTVSLNVSPGSACFGTPQRLQDLQLVKQRLKHLGADKN